jgi:ABC-2 type transport system permease protein
VNIVFLPTIFISGVFYDEENAPQFLHDIAQALPLTHIIDGLSGAMVTGHGIQDNLSALGVIAVWTVFGVAMAIRGFSWESKRA